MISILRVVLIIFHLKSPRPRKHPPTLPFTVTMSFDALNVHILRFLIDLINRRRALIMSTLFWTTRCGSVASCFDLAFVYLAFVYTNVNDQRVKLLLTVSLYFLDAQLLCWRPECDTACVGCWRRWQCFYTSKTAEQNKKEEPKKEGSKKGCLLVFWTMLFVGSLRKIWTRKIWTILRPMFMSFLLHVISHSRNSFDYFRRWMLQGEFPQVCLYVALLFRILFSLLSGLAALSWFEFVTIRSSLW